MKSSGKHRLLMSVALAALTGITATCAYTKLERGGGDGRLGFLESSGIVKSRQHEGVFWTHADSGTSERLYAVAVDGRTLARFESHEVKNLDWEDIATDDSGRLYVGDIGNNRSDRLDLAVYVFQEPRALDRDGALVLERKIPFRYPDQIEYPSPQEAFDAESLFWSQSTLYLLTKHRADTRSTLYRFPKFAGSAQVVLERISERDLGDADKFLGGMSTGADVSADGRWLAVSSYRSILLFEAPTEGDDWFARPHSTIPLRVWSTNQVEAIAWDGNDLVLTNEPGSVFRVSEPLAGMHAFPPQ